MATRNQVIRNWLTSFSEGAVVFMQLSDSLRRGCHVLCLSNHISDPAGQASLQIRFHQTLVRYKFTALSVTSSGLVLLYDVFLGNCCHSCNECTTDGTVRAADEVTLCLRFILSCTFDHFSPSVFLMTLWKRDWRIFVTVWSLYAHGGLSVTGRWSCCRDYGSALIT